MTFKRFVQLSDVHCTPSAECTFQPSACRPSDNLHYGYSLNDVNGMLDRELQYRVEEMDVFLLCDAVTLETHCMKDQKGMSLKNKDFEQHGT